MDKAGEYAPNEIKSSVIELIGNTPLLALDRLYRGPGRLLVKCEFLNPGASVKDRTALAMLKYAREDGSLKERTPIIEMTGGNQGCGLAMVAAVLGHPATMVMSSGFSRQRVEMMKCYGAQVHLSPQVDGRPGSVTGNDGAKVFEDTERLIAATPNVFYVNQFCNANNWRAHAETTGPEIYRQAGGHVDAFIAAVGSAGTFVGVGKYLKQQNPRVQCYVIEPEGAEVIAGKEVTKPMHLLQGIGIGRVPDLFDHSLLDGTFAVSDEEAVDCVKQLGTKEGLCVGYTSGANVAGAIKLLSSGRLPPDAWVVTILNDTGLKYSFEY